MNFLSVFNVMIPVILIPLAGYILSFYKKADVKILSALVIYVTSPALFIISLSAHRFDGKELIITVFAAAAVICGAALFLRLAGKRFSFPLGLHYPIIFMNSGFIGLPLILMAFGMRGLVHAIIYDMVNGLLIFTLGIYILSGKMDRWQAFKTPVIYSALAAFLLNYFHIRIPEPVWTALVMLGGATIPLALIMLGYQLGGTKIRSLKLPFIGATLRSSIGIMIAFIIVKLLNIQGMLASVLLIMSALPSALTGVVFAEEFRKEDAPLVAETIAVSTLLSIIYLPLIMAFIK